MSTYRLDRAAAMATAGVLVLLAAAAAVAAFSLVPRVGGALAVLLLLAAALVTWRPPVVARLDEHGLRTRRDRTRWTDVDDVRLEQGQLVLAGEGREHRLDLRAVGLRRRELVREVYDRLNTAHGYRRWEPGA